MLLCVNGNLGSRITLAYRVDYTHAFKQRLRHPRKCATRALSHFHPVRLGNEGHLQCEVGWVFHDMQQMQRTGEHSCQFFYVRRGGLAAIGKVDGEQNAFELHGFVSAMQWSTLRSRLL